jgi:hypothetical protein
VNILSRLICIVNVSYDLWKALEPSNGILVHVVTISAHNVELYYSIITDDGVFASHDIDMAKEPGRSRFGVTVIVHF